VSLFVLEGVCPLYSVGNSMVYLYYLFLGGKMSVHLCDLASFDVRKGVFGYLPAADTVALGFLKRCVRWWEMLFRLRRQGFERM